MALGAPGAAPSSHHPGAAPLTTLTRTRIFAEAKHDGAVGGGAQELIDLDPAVFHGIFLPAD